MSNSADLHPVITSDDLNKATSQATTVTNYAQASISAVPQLQGTEDWMAPIVADVDQAQANAQNWLSNLCPAISSAMPQDIIAFNTQFQTASGTLLSTLEDINNQPGSIPTVGQKQAVSDQLNNLVSGVKTLQSGADTLLSEIASFADNLNTDQQKLSTDLGLAATKYADGAGYVRSVSTILGESFLDSSVIGPCSAIVNIDFNISMKVEQTGCDPDLISLIYNKAIVSTQIGNVQASQLSAQLILDSWTILSKKIDALITSLNAVSDDAYAAFIEQLDIADAQTQWEQLTQFAQTLVSNTQFT